MRSLFLMVALMLMLNPLLRAADDYAPGPDSIAQPGVPQGTVTKYTFDKSRIFPGTTRDYWIYVPKQYDPAKPACLMVFQDGVGYKAPNVFDNLIARKEIPVMIGVFITPGRVKALTTNGLDRFNRSFEYDGLGNNYVRFLSEELLPLVTAKYHISTNADDRGIAGSSSGAIAAFTAAWERPDLFRRVFSSVGTFVGLRGGNNYPTLIRKTEPKPLRVFLQDGTGDLNIYGGNWHLANEEMLSALEFSGYEVNHNWGDGGHNNKQATAIFPDAMRWLWQDYPKPIQAGKDSKQPVMTLVSTDAGWEAAGMADSAVESTGFYTIDGLAVNAAGDVFFSSHTEIERLGATDGKHSVFSKGSEDVGAIAFGADGNLYANLPKAKQIVAFDAEAKMKVIAEGVICDSLTVTYGNEIYFSDAKDHQVWFIDANQQKRVVDTGIASPMGLRLTPDQGFLQVSDPTDQFIYSFQILPDGGLTNRQRFFDLHLIDGANGSGAGSMTTDSNGWLYTATSLGIQVCDEPGRVEGIIALRWSGKKTQMVFGGTDMKQIFVASDFWVFKRKVNVKGLVGCELPFKLPNPHL